MKIREWWRVALPVLFLLFGFGWNNFSAVNRTRAPVFERRYLTTFVVGYHFQYLFVHTTELSPRHWIYSQNISKSYLFPYKTCISFFVGTDFKRYFKNKRVSLYLYLWGSKYLYRPDVFHVACLERYTCSLDS